MKQNILNKIKLISTKAIPIETELACSSAVQVSDGFVYSIIIWIQSQSDNVSNNMILSECSSPHTSFQFTWFENAYSLPTRSEYIHISSLLHGQDDQAFPCLNRDHCPLNSKGEIVIDVQSLFSIRSLQGEDSCSHRLYKIILLQTFIVLRF